MTPLFSPLFTTEGLAGVVFFGFILLIILGALVATNAVNFDGPNTVVVKITNNALNELGTGGIVAPVMLWTPNDPSWIPGQ